MSYSAKDLAATRDLHVLVTIYLAPSEVQIGGTVVRVTERALSSGAYVAVTDAASVSQIYTPRLAAPVPLRQEISLAGQSFDISWWLDLADDIDPVSVRFDHAVVEIHLVHETGTGTAIEETLPGAELWFRGRVTDWAVGDRDEPARVTAATPDVQDRGTIFAPGSALSADLFADIGNDTELGRARNSDGLHAPLVFCGKDSSIVFLVPAPCIVDVIDATSASPGPGVALTPSRHIGTWGRLADESNRQAYLVHPTRRRPNKLITDSTYYAAAPLAAVDSMGRDYTYFKGDWRERWSAAGSANITFTNTSATVTGIAGARFYNLGEGDQMVGYDGAPHADTEFKRINEIQTSRSLDLVAIYGGASTTSDEANVIRLPVDQADGVLMDYGTYGGLQGERGSAPLATAPELIRRLLRRSQLNVPINWGSLRNLEDRMQGWRIHAAIRDDGSPWEYIQRNILPWIPVRPYLDASRLSFAWMGPVSDLEALDTLSLDEFGNGERDSLISWTPVSSLAEEVRLQYRWSIHQSRYKDRISVVAAIADEDNITTRQVPCGRAKHHATLIRAGGGHRQVQAVEMEIPSVFDRTTIGLIAAYIIYRSRQVAQCSLSLPASWSWLRPGHLIKIVEAEAFPSGMISRVESVDLSSGSYAFASV